MKPWPLLLMVIALPGCVHEENRRAENGGWTPEFLSEPAPARAVETSPSVTGLSRENWTPITITCAADAVVHNETFVSRPIYTRGARSAGEFPDERSATEDAAPGNERRQRYEAFAMPMWAVWDLLNVPMRLWAQPFVDGAPDQGPVRERQSPIVKESTP
jgi:hypothetical protein